MLYYCESNRYGGMLSFLVQPRSIGGVCGDGGEEALRISREVRLFKAATSLGGTESLIEHRRSVEGEHPVSPPNLLRLSVSVTADTRESIPTILTPLHVLGYRWAWKVVMT